MYDKDTTLKSLIDEYNLINDKLVPFFEMAEKTKKLMDKVMKDVKPSEDIDAIMKKNKEFVDGLKKDFSDEIETQTKECIENLPKEDISLIFEKKSEETPEVK